MFTSSLKGERYRLSTVASVVLGTVLGGLTLVAIGLPVRFAVLSFIGLLTPFIGILSGDVKRFFLSLLVLDIVLGLDIHLGHDPTVIAHPNGVPFSLTTISLVVLYTIWFGEVVVTKKTKPKLFPQVSLPAFCLIGTGLISILNSRNTLLSFFEIVQLGEMFLVYLYVANHIKGEKDIKMILRVLLWGLLLEATVILVQYLTRTRFDLMFKYVEVLTTGDHLFRVAGTFGEPNVAAGYLTPVLIICLSLLLSRTGMVRKSLTWVPFSLGLVALVVTFSRGGWFAFLGGMSFLLMLNRRYRWLNVSPKAMFVGIVTLAFLASIFGAAVVRRLTSQYDSALARIPLTRLSLGMIKAQPLIGVGINNFGLVMKDYVTAELAGEWLYITHNKYLTVWAEMGTIGLLAFLWFLLSVFGEAFRCLRSNRPLISPLALGIVGGLCGYATHMMVDVFEQRGLVQLLWTLAGVVVGMASLLPKGRTHVMPKSCTQLSRACADTNTIDTVGLLGSSELPASTRGVSCLL